MESIVMHHRRTRRVFIRFMCFHLRVVYSQDHATTRHLVATLRNLHGRSLRRAGGLSHLHSVEYDTGNVGATGGAGATAFQPRAHCHRLPHINGHVRLRAGVQSV
jgi:hypothetical protein